MSLGILQSVLGLGAIVGFAWVLSENRRSFPLGTVLVGIAIQLALALLLLKVPVARQGILALNGVVTALTDATTAGTSFVFGYVGGGKPPFEVTNPANAYSLAFQALPLVLIISEIGRAHV